MRPARLLLLAPPCLPLLKLRGTLLLGMTSALLLQVQTEARAAGARLGATVQIQQQAILGPAGSGAQSWTSAALGPTRSVALSSTNAAPGTVVPDSEIGRAHV